MTGPAARSGDRALRSGQGAVLSGNGAGESGGEAPSRPAHPASALPVAALSRLLDRPISDEQAAIVCAPLTAGVVIAGAGSGKTATMVARVVWLVATGLVRPEAVLGLTFTTKAADELAGRVRQGLRRLRSEGLLPAASTPAADQPGNIRVEVASPPGLGAPDLEPTISTYHSYAARLVRDHGLRLGREPGARLITPATSWQLAARVVASYDGPMDAVSWAESTVIAAVLSLAGDLAEHLATPEQVLRVGRWLREVEGREGVQARGHQVVHCQRIREQLLPLVAHYGRLKGERDLLDFGDAVSLASELARDHPAVRELERATYRVVLLDEYQDTGSAQEVLLASLYGDGHAVTAVGDPCQSIYGWRGASSGTLRRFATSFAAAHSAPRHLATTYRSGGRILQLANELSEPLRHEGVRVPRLAAAPGREADGQIRCALLPDVGAEAEWVARQVRTAVLALPPGGPAHWSRAAVLCRKRSLFPRLRAAFDALDVPVEVVGLGGLLDVPEVADIVATLRVLADPTADADLLRLLTGPRWRIGPRDLAALGQGARTLVHSRVRADDPMAAIVLGADETQSGSLVDALDDLPPAPDALSPQGRLRLETLRQELAGLRRRTAQPLPDLVNDVERTLGLDIEVVARPGAGPPAAARADLDAFADAAADFAGDAAQDGAGPAVLSAFLAFLAVAEDEEHGLDTGTPGAADTVKLMTIHAAKGLEWPVVAVPGMSRGERSAVFPAKARASTSWVSNARLLPFPLRGDRDDLPGLVGLDASSLTKHLEVNGERDAREERRLAYVAVTRAQQVLLCSGYHWGEATTVLGPSEFLRAARQACQAGAGEVDTWIDVPPTRNPVETTGRSRAWPESGVPADARVVTAARRVRELLATVRPGASAAPGRQTPHRADGPDRAGGPEPSDTTVAGGPEPSDTTVAGADGDLALTPAALLQVAGWDADLSRLTEEARRRRGTRRGAVLPGQLSVSTLVELRRDPAALARRLQRPVPRRPSPLSRRGTAFHLWLEKEVFGQPQLLDPEELPGAADDGAGGDDQLALLQQAFRASAWWGRNPHEIEVPFEMELAGTLVRGRMDAVYRMATEAGDRYEIVDWKTGAMPGPADRAAANVQLATYRLAWHRLTEVALERIDATFYYVASGREVRPTDLLDGEGLAALLTGLPSAPA